MQVRATARGYYGRLIEAGEVFECHNDEDLGSWMEVIEASDRARLQKRIDQFAIRRRPVASPTAPATTAQLRDPVKPGKRAPKAVKVDEKADDKAHKADHKSKE